MKTVILAAFALAFAASALPLSSADAAMVRRAPDLTVIAPAPVVAVATEQTVKRRVAVTKNTDTAD